MFFWAVIFAGFLLAASPSSASDRYQQELSYEANQLLVGVQELMQAEKYREALAGIDAFREKNPRRSFVLVEFFSGNLNFFLDHFQPAADAYRRTVKLAPDFLQAQENLGMALLALERYHEAAGPLVRAAALAAKDAPDQRDRLLAYAGNAYLLAGEYREAQPLFTQLVHDRQNPLEEHCLALLRIYLELNELRPAEALLVSLLDRFPRQVSYWRLLGQVRVTVEQPTAALAAYKLVALIDPEPRDLKTLAQLYQMVSLPLAAAKTLERCLEGQEQVGDQEMERLAALYGEAGDIDRALFWLEKKQAVSPAPENQLRRGEILYRAGRYREGHDLLSTIDRLPNNDGYQFLLAGYCAWYAGDLAAARDAFSRAQRYGAYRTRSTELLKTVTMILEQEPPSPSSS
ncbi:MAG: tetratricopeptide repeat protein [Deltaproteobacteria bacterium]|nr:tetratricopeptide repeat protein [Candidatus Anaeroferrophillus wilburensis]MBN2889840.1 tetratricopeptide repeat protein [Deltaproteobacteria bacterium]